MPGLLTKTPACNLSTWPQLSPSKCPNRGTRWKLALPAFMKALKIHSTCPHTLPVRTVTKAHPGSNGGTKTLPLNGGLSGHITNRTCDMGNITMGVCRKHTLAPRQQFCHNNSDPSHVQNAFMLSSEVPSLTPRVFPSKSSPRMTGWLSRSSV